MRVHEVLIVPAAGYLSAEGIYTRGHQTARITELDVVDRYVRAIEDEFDNASIRHQTMQTRKRPGIPENTRHLGILPGTLVLHCRIGWDEASPSKLNTTNRSRIYYHGYEGYGLATLLEESLSHWGTLYVSHKHLCANPAQDPVDKLLTVKDCVGIRLEPFVLNGPDAEAYCTKLEQLGRDVGRTIADFLMAQESTARMQPCTINGTKLKAQTNQPMAKTDVSILKDPV